MPLSFLVNRVPAQPIIVITLTAPFAADQVEALYGEIDSVAAEIEGHYYRALDLSAITVSLADLMRLLVLATEQQPGSASDPRARSTVYIGASDTVRIALRILGDTLERELDMRLFETLEQALDWIYADMEGH